MHWRQKLKDNFDSVGLDTRRRIQKLPPPHPWKVGNHDLEFFHEA